MTNKIQTIGIKKNDQSYLTQLMIAYPKINSGRKNYVSQFNRILKNILLSKAYKLSLKNKNLNFFKSSSFEENNKFLSIMFKLK